MSLAEWYLAVYAIGNGVSVIGFWAWVVGGGRLGALGEGRDDFDWHVAAEVTAGGLLLISGIGLLAAQDARWPLLLNAVGLGAIVYALVESAGHYLARGNRMMVGVVAIGWVFTLPALVLRFTTG